MLKRIVSLAIVAMIVMGMAAIAVSAADAGILDKLLEATAKAGVPIKTAASDKATITVEDWSGTTQSHEFSIGDEFTVTSYLQTPEDKRVNSLDVWQTFNEGDATVSLVSSIDDMIDDTDYFWMFPCIKNPTANVANDVIKANASAAKYVQASNFTAEKSILIRAKYKVIAGGTTKIKTNILSLAYVDKSNSMTNEIQKSAKVGTETVKTSTVFENIDEPVIPSETPTEVVTEPATEIASEVATEPESEIPTQPAETDSPTEAVEDTEVATEPPAADGLWIVADGKWYKVQKGQTYTYTYYLNTGEYVCSLDAETMFDIDGLEWNKVLDDDELDLAALYPVIKDSMILNDSVEGRLKYNYSAAKGKKFDTDEKQLITMSFTVTADEGVYHIDTFLHTLAGLDEKKYIFKDEIVEAPAKSQGYLDAESSEEHPTEPVTEEPTSAPVSEEVTEVAPPTEAEPTSGKAYPANSFFLTGSINGWELDEAFMLTSTNNADAEEYSISGVLLSTTDMFKVAKTSDTGIDITDWYPDGEDEYISAAANSSFTILFRPNGDGSAEDGWIYSGPQAASASDTMAMTGASEHTGYMFKLIDEAEAAGTADSEGVTEAATEGVTEVATEAATTSSDPASDANVIYFNPDGTGWSDYDSIGFHVWAIDDDAFTGYFWEDAGQVGKKASNGKWYYDFDDAKLTIKKGKQYGVIFYAIKDGKATDQTYNLLFGTPCIGHTAFCDGTTYENPEDSEKTTLIAYWDKGVDSTVYGPELQITSIGTVVGTCCPSGSTPYQLFLDFLYNKLDNARTYSGKDDQTLLDDIGSALGFTTNVVQQAIDETGLSVSWSAQASSLSTTEAEQATIAPIRKKVTPKIIKPANKATTPPAQGTSPHTGTPTAVYIILSILAIAAAGVYVSARKLRKTK